MTKLFLAALVLWSPLAGCDVPNDDENAQVLNVNSRYTVESVQVSGKKDWRISDTLRSELNKIVGSKLDHATLEALADRIKKELQVSDVSIKVGKGTNPDSVAVNFEVPKSHEHIPDINLINPLYDSKEGWSGGTDFTAKAGGNSFTVGVMSYADDLLERYAGVHAKVQSRNLGTDRLRISFDFDSLHEQWNNATLAAAGPFDIYRTRQDFTPEATLVIAAPLELDLGVRFSRFRPEALAARTESSNAVVSTLRYHQRWGSAHDTREQELWAFYSLAAATRLFDTDPVFARHEGSALYRLRHNHSTVQVRFKAGSINGNAPLFDRFVLGTGNELRGWNKFELDPLGGSHVAYGSVDYFYRLLWLLYDTGAVWDRPQDREQKQSAGAGFKVDKLQLAVAFPIRSGRVEPVFIAGMSF